MIDKNFKQRFHDKISTDADESQRYIWSEIYYPIFLAAERKYFSNYWKSKIFTYFASAANIISSIIIATFVGFIGNDNSSGSPMDKMGGEKILMWTMVALSILGALAANMRDSHQKESNLSTAIMQKFYSEARQYSSGICAYKNVTPHASIDLLFTRLEKIKLNASYGNPDAVLSTFESKCEARLSQLADHSHTSVDISPDI